MAKPINKNMYNAILDYQTGQYSLCEVAKKWKIDKATLSRHFKKNNTTINQHAKNAIEYTNKGIYELGELIKEPEIKQQLLENASSPLVDEVLHIIRSQNPQFARGFQAISTLILERSHDILTQEKITSGDLSNVSKAIANINDTLQVVPKAPSIAQQFNFNQQNNKKEKDTLNIKIHFD